MGKTVAQDTPSRKLDQYIVRMPDGMRDDIKRAAEESGRSMNAEIIQRLKGSFEGDDDELLRLKLPADTEHALFTDAAINDVDIDARAIQILQAHYGQVNDYTESLGRVEHLANENLELSNLVTNLTEKQDADFLLYYGKGIQLNQFAKTVLALGDAIPKHVSDIANELVELNEAEVLVLRRRYEQIAYVRKIQENIAERSQELEREIRENDDPDDANNED